MLTLIVAEFKERKVSYALIGGFALGLYGVVRSTNDLDFLVDKDDLEKVDAVMSKYSYRCSFRSKSVFRDKLKLPVVKPEDLIGLKLQLMTNAPQRSHREMSDIKGLLAVCGPKLDWKLLKDYFSLFSMNKQFKQVRE